MIGDQTTHEQDAPRKPRITLLGEFSSGKSTLANALLRRTTSPMRVTATHVPPIWYTEGEGAPVRVGVDGSETTVESDDLSGVPMAETRCVRVFLRAEFLRSFDLFDMPGSSDPNMSPEIWDAMLPLADMAIWCTPASQAWRQSEAAIWDEVPEALHDRSLLLLTRFDKVASPEDRARVLNRVSRATDGLFKAVLPASLLQAVEADGDKALWDRSGLGAVTDALADIRREVMDPKPQDAAEIAATLRRQRSAGPVAMPESDVASPSPAVPDPTVTEPVLRSPAADASTGSGVVPRRISTGSSAGGRRIRRFSPSEGSMM